MERGLQRVNHQGHLTEWSRKVEACRKIGQRVSEWCREHGIPVSTYYSWQRKVFQAAVSGNEVCFTEVSVRPAAAETAASIQCGELRVDIHMGAGPETISHSGAEGMLNDFKCGCPVYLACGYTDLRQGIDGLAGLVQTRFQLDPFQNALFLFCGRRKDRIKGLYWEGDGFVLLYKRLENGKFQWPRNGEEARQLTPQQYRWLMEQLRLLKKKQFGASSEQTKEQLDGQLSLLFNEAEAYAAPLGPQKTTQAAAHTRKQSGSVKDVVPDNIPVEVVEHRLSAEERVCPQCGELMQEIGTEVRVTLKLIPAKAILCRGVYYTYACETCEKNDVSTPIVKTSKEPSVIPGSSIAHIMTQKFVMASPLYRQEQEWARQGLKLSRQTMSNWVLQAAEDHLLPVYEEMHRRLVKREVLHADETTLQVLHEPGKKAQTKSYMWLYRTGRDGEPPIVLYEYQPNRKAEHAVKFLKGFSRYLHADGYQGCHRLPENIQVVGCWAHARRKFDEALNTLPPDQREGTAALTGLEYCNQLFAWEKQFESLSPKERTKQRLKEEKPILAALLAWADSASAAPKSALGKALHYLKEQWPYLLRYLEDGGLELSNNRAERGIKPFVIGRKNFLFANTPLGSQASAVIYSLIETVKETGLDPFRYLTWILETAPTLNRTLEGWAVPLLPANAPEFCPTT